MVVLMLVIGNSVVVHGADRVLAITQSICCPVCLEDKTEDMYSLLPIFQCKGPDGRPLRHFVCSECIDTSDGMEEGRISVCPECRAPRIIDQRQPVALTLEQQALQARVAILLETLNGVSADLRFANLMNADLRGAHLRGADLTNADLAGANLTNADLTRADLDYADLSYADLGGVNLTNAGLSFADLKGADLTNANLEEARLVMANLEEVNLTRADLRFSDLRSANLTRVDLRFSDLRSANLTNADLTGVDLSFTNLKSVNLTNADLTNAYLIGANLILTNLTGTDLSRVANLEGVRFIRPVGLSSESRAYAIAHGAIVEDSGLSNNSLKDLCQS